jgi:hypothetical protein
MPFEKVNINRHIIDRFRFDPKSIKSGIIQIKNNPHKVKQMPVEWSSNDEYLRIGPLAFIKYDFPDSVKEVRQKLGEEALRKWGNNILFYVPQDPRWGIRGGSKAANWAPAPFISTYTVPVIAAMLFKGCAGQSVTDFGSGYGILSLLALRLGAGRVHAIEKYEDAVYRAAGVMEVNGYSSENIGPQSAPIKFLNQSFGRPEMTENPQSLGLPKELIETTDVAVANIGSAYGSAHEDIIEAAGAWPKCKTLILGGYTSPYYDNDRGKRESILDQMATAGFVSQTEIEFRYAHGINDRGAEAWGSKYSFIGVK